MSAQPNQDSAPGWATLSRDPADFLCDNEHRAAEFMSIDKCIASLEHMFAPSKARQALRLATIPTRCLSRSNNSVHQCPCGCSKFQPGLSSSLFPRQLSSITFQNSRAVILEQNTRYTGPKRGYASGLSNQWATEAEEAHAKLIEAAEARVNVYKKVLEDVSVVCNVNLCGQSDYKNEIVGSRSNRHRYQGPNRKGKSAKRTRAFSRSLE